MENNTSNTITATELIRLKREQGVKDSIESATPEVSDRMNTVSSVDRAKTKDGEVRHKNMLSFLGEKAMTSDYRQHRKRLDADPNGMYAKPELGIVDKVGEYVRNAGYLWYTKTDTYQNDQKATAAQGTGPAEEQPEVPDTILGHIGYAFKEGEMNPLTERVTKLFNVPSDMEKNGLNQLINHNNAAVMQQLRDTVLDNIDIVDASPGLTSSMLGEQGYAGADVADFMAEQLLAAGVGNLMSGEEGTSTASTAYETLIGVTQKVSAIDRAEAVGIVDGLIAKATAMVTDSAMELGGFTSEQTQDAQNMADPRGIVMKPMKVVPGQTPKEVYQSGITYPLVRAAAYFESAILNKASATVMMEQVRRNLLSKIENPVARQAVETAIEALPIVGGKTMYSQLDAQVLDTLMQELDPVNGSLSVFTPSVMETRAYRSMEARKKGMGSYVLNEATEGAFDFAMFLIEMQITRGIAMKTPLAPFISGKVGVGARMTERLSRTTPGGLTALTADKVLNATRVANTLRNAAFVGVNRAMSTGGDLQTRAVSGMLTAIYSSTPATTALLLKNIGYTGTGVVVPVVVDFVSNSLITTAIFYAPQYAEAKRAGTQEAMDTFIGNAVVQGIFDLGMAASTRAFMSSDRMVKTSMIRDGKYYDAVKEQNYGKDPINVLTGKSMSKDEFITKKMQQRAKLESVQEVLDGLTRLYKEKATGDRSVEGTPEVEVTTKGYRDPAVSRFLKLETKIAEQKDKLYSRLSETIDKKTALEDKINAEERDKTGEVDLAAAKKEMSILQGQETKARNEIDIIERKGAPQETEKPEAQPEGESQKSVDSRARRRIMETYKEIKTVTKEEADLNKEIEALKEAGKPTKRLEGQQDALLNKIRDLQIERDAMLYTEGTPREVTLKEFERAQLESIDKQIKQFKKGLKAGGDIAQKDLTSFRKYAEAVINKSLGVTDKQKLQMNGLLKGIKNGKSLDKTLSKLWLRIDDVRGENEKQLFIEASDRLLAKAKKAIKNGKFDADTSAAFMAAIKARNMQVTEVTEFGRSSAEMLLFDVSQLARLDLTKEQARAVYNDLTNIYDNGAATKSGMEAHRKARNETLILASLNDIEGTKGPAPSKSKDEISKEDRTPLRRRIVQWNRRWGGLIQDLVRFSPTARGESVLERMTDMFHATRYAETVQKEFNDARADAYNKIFGLNHRNKIHTKTTQDLEAIYEVYRETTKVDRDTKEESIVPRPEKMSRTVMRQRWMEWDQPEGRARLEKNSGFTEKTMQDIEKHLTAQDFELIRELRISYDKLYTAVNEVYRELVGKDLPYRTNYSPFIPVKTEKTDPDLNMIELMGGQLPGARPGDKTALKELGRDSTLNSMGDVFIYDRYISDMAHYIGYAKTVTDARTIFADGRIRDAITQRDGSGALTNIKSHLDVFGKGKIAAAQNGAFSSLHKYISRWYAGSLFAQPKRTAIQLLSGMLYMTEMSTADFMKGLWSLPGAAKSGELEVITKSVFMLERGLSPTRDMQLAADVIKEQRGVWARKFIDNPRLTDYMGIFIKLGDRGGIMAGAWGLYRHYTEGLKMDKTEALSKTLNFVNNTQQSRDLSQMSTGLMSGDPFKRLGSMYVHTPQQYFNNLWDALVSKGRISNMELAKTIVAYEAMTVAYTFIQNAGKVTAITAFSSMLAGPIANGLPFIREGATAIVASVLAAVLDKRSNTKTGSYPIQRWYTDIQSVIKMTDDLMREGPDMQSVVDITAKMVEVSLPATGAIGAGLKAGGNIISGAIEFSRKNDLGYMLGKFAGYTDYQLEDK